MAGFVGALIGTHGPLAKQIQKNRQDFYTQARNDREWDEIVRAQGVGFDPELMRSNVNTSPLLTPEMKKDRLALIDRFLERSHANQTLQTLNAPSQRPQLAAPPAAPPQQMAPPPGASGTFPGMGAAMSAAAPTLMPPPQDPVQAMAEQRGTGFGTPLPETNAGLFWSPERISQFGANAAGAKAGAVAAAEAPSKIAEARAAAEARGEAELRVWDERYGKANDFIDRMTKQQPGSHWITSVSANGFPTPKQDRGVGVPGWVHGTELPANATLLGSGGKSIDPSDADKYYRLIRYADESIEAQPSDTAWKTVRGTTSDGRQVMYAVDRSGNIVPGTERTLGIAPSMMGTQSANTRVEPGGLTTTTTATRQRVPLGQPTRSLNPPPVASASPQGGIPNAPMSQAAQNARTMADAWVKGGPTPPARWMPLVQADLSARGIASPVPLTGGGGKDLAAVDAVLSQVNGAMQQMQQEGLDKSEDRNILGNDYLKYRRLGSETPHNDLFTNLNFERYRSGGAALQGVGSRARQVLQDALIHTPNLEPAAGNFAGGQFRSDTPATIYGKLRTIQKILADKRQSVVEDERKSGVVAPSSLTAPPLVAPIQLKDGRTLQPHTQADADRFRRDHPELIK